jgi:hypothetical protein
MIETSANEIRMDFTLKYAGPLISQQSTHAKLAKTNLRAELHKQLEVLWRVHPVFREPATSPDPGTLQRQNPRAFRISEAMPGVLYASEVWNRFLVGGIDYVPIVTYGHRLLCHLDIRLHSRRIYGGIIHAGPDLDNRLKVLLDALSIPNAGQSGTTANETSNEEPLMFCLLEDDELVTKLSVETFRLLKTKESASANDGNDNYVEVDIDVHVSPASPTPVNYPFLFP